jgi:hypothetical protein
MIGFGGDREFSDKLSMLRIVKISPKRIAPNSIFPILRFYVGAAALTSSIGSAKSRLTVHWKICLLLSPYYLLQF